MIYGPHAVTSRCWLAIEKRLAHYFDKLSQASMGHSRLCHCFASYALGMMSESERKSLKSIATSLTDDPREAERTMLCRTGNDLLSWGNYSRRTNITRESRH